jgi:hypothetical protein
MLLYIFVFFFSFFYITIQTLIWKALDMSNLVINISILYPPFSFSVYMYALRCTLRQNKVKSNEASHASALIILAFLFFFFFFPIFFIFLTQVSYCNYDCASAMTMHTRREGETVPQTHATHTHTHTFTAWYCQMRKLENFIIRYNLLLQEKIYEIKAYAATTRRESESYSKEGMMNLHVIWCLLTSVDYFLFFIVPSSHQRKQNVYK